MTHVLLARHGETEWNASGRVQGHTNSPLSPRGQEQAAALASRLAHTQLDAVYSSDLTRAQDTASAIAAPHGLTVQIDPRLREKSFGAWEGLTASEIEAGWPDAWQRYHVLHALEETPPGGEDWPAVQERMLAFLHDALRAHPAQTVLIVGHGGSLRTILLFALDAPLSHLRRLHLDNASLSRVHFAKDRPPRLLLLNDTSHWENGP